MKPKSSSPTKNKREVYDCVDHFISSICKLGLISAFTDKNFHNSDVYHLVKTYNTPTILKIIKLNG